MPPFRHAHSGACTIPAAFRCARGEASWWKQDIIDAQDEAAASVAEGWPES